MEEIWKDVVGYEGLYEVSSYGRIKRLPRITVSKRCLSSIKEIMLKPGLYQGYEKVILTKDRKRRTTTVHRIVAIAFLGYKQGLSVNHIDFNRSNNRIENLEWCTHRENVMHSRRNNRYPKLVRSDEEKERISEKLSKKVICTNTLVIYKNSKGASIQLGYKESTLKHYLLGTRTNKTSLMFLHEYENKQKLKEIQS